MSSLKLSEQDRSKHIRKSVFHSEPATKNSVFELAHCRVKAVPAVLQSLHKRYQFQAKSNRALQIMWVTALHSTVDTHPCSAREWSIFDSDLACRNSPFKPSLQVLEQKHKPMQRSMFTPQRLQQTSRDGYANLQQGGLRVSISQNQPLQQQFKHNQFMTQCCNERLTRTSFQVSALAFPEARKCSTMTSLSVSFEVKPASKKYRTNTSNDCSTRTSRVSSKDETVLSIWNKHQHLATSLNLQVSRGRLTSQKNLESTRKWSWLGTLQPNLRWLLDFLLFATLESHLLLRNK